MTEQAAVRNADTKDYDRIASIYKYARDFMAKTGNASQWGDAYPPEELIREDMARERLYVIESGGTVHGVFSFEIGEDATYAVIEQGEWLSDSEYGAIHRVAGDGRLHGVFHIAVSFCEEKISHLRIDTHENNKVMQHVIEKNGFRRCGIIYNEEGSQRIAYEKTSSLFCSDMV